MEDGFVQLLEVDNHQHGQGVAGHLQSAATARQSVMFGKVSGSEHERTYPRIRLRAQTDLRRVPHAHPVLETNVAADARGSVDELEDGHPGIDDRGQSGTLRNGRKNLDGHSHFLFLIIRVVPIAIIVNILVVKIHVNVKITTRKTETIQG